MYSPSRLDIVLVLNSIKCSMIQVVGSTNLVFLAIRDQLGEN